MNGYMFPVLMHEKFGCQFYIPCILFSKSLHFIDVLKFFLQNKTSLWLLPSLGSKWENPIHWNSSYSQVESQRVRDHSSPSLFAVCKLLSKSLRCQCCVEPDHLNPNSSSIITSNDYCVYIAKCVAS